MNISSALFRLSFSRGGQRTRASARMMIVLFGICIDIRALILEGNVGFKLNRNTHRIEAEVEVAGETVTERQRTEQRTTEGPAMKRRKIEGKEGGK